MPWIKSKLCTGCTLCMQDCPADAIGIENHILVIDQSACIRCGICHDICPSGAVRHDSEKIPAEVQKNLQWIQTLQNHPYYAGNSERQAELTQRLIKHFNRLAETAEETLNKLKEETQTNS